MKLIIANWKMNPRTHAEAKALCEATIAVASQCHNVKTVICPPFTKLPDCGALIATHRPTIEVGAQDVFWADEGPYTGEISAGMLRDNGVKYVLVGHSDRRYVLGETDEMISKKVKAVLAHDIVPILLVGEQERGDTREDVLIDQLSRDLEGLTAEQVSKVVIGYEPVWAISTTRDATPDSPEGAAESIALIKDIISRLYPGIFPSPLFLYGGSVNADNAHDFLSRADISGAVVGGASLKPDVFGKVLKAANSIMP